MTEIDIDFNLNFNLSFNFISILFLILIPILFSILLVKNNTKSPKQILPKIADKIQKCERLPDKVILRTAEQAHGQNFFNG